MNPSEANLITDLKNIEYNILHILSILPILQMSADSKLQVSMFQIPESVRIALVKVSGLSVVDGKKSSMNTCILEALEGYLGQSIKTQTQPSLPRGPLRNFTVRTTSEMKSRLGETAARWQVELGYPITMNAVLNTALLQYLHQKLPDFDIAG